MEERELSFIHSTGKPMKDGQANKIVRAHVMRRFKQQQRAEARARKQSPAEPSPDYKNSRGCPSKAHSPYFWRHSHDGLLYDSAPLLRLPRPTHERCLRKADGGKSLEPDDNGTIGGTLAASSLAQSLTRSER